MKKFLHTGLAGLLVAVALVAAPSAEAKLVEPSGGTTTVEEQIIEYNENLSSPDYNLEQSTHGTFENMLLSILNMTLGTPTAESGGPTDDDFGIPSRQLNYEGGMIQDLSGMISYMYANPAADTQSYVADVMNSAGIATPAYAQGVGFSSLNPVLGVWKKFRDLAYTFFVLIFLVIGFLIMTRRKIGGQTVVTAQQAIPRVIIALLAVTFSYAMAGLLIDVMYIMMYLLIGVFGKTPDSFLGKGVFDLSYTLISGSFSSARVAVSAYIDQYIDWELLGVGFSDLGGIGAAVIIAIAVLFALFSLFFELLKTYVSIILSVAMAPLILMVGAIPGRSNFGRWLNNLFGNLMAFPLVLVLLLIFDEITGAFTESGVVEIQDGGFSPPFLFGISGAGSISFLIGLGMIMIMKELVVQGKKALGVQGTIFDQLSVNLKDAVVKGWKGGELVPGLGFTDTNKLPVIQRAGGLSGKNIVRKGAIGVGGTLGAIPTAPAIFGYKATQERGNKRQHVGQSVTWAGRNLAKTLNDPQLAPKKSEEKKT